MISTRIDQNPSMLDEAICHISVAAAPDASTYLFGFRGTCTVGVGCTDEGSLTSELGDSPPPGLVDRLL
jgi:hypothetical protein